MVFVTCLGHYPPSHPANLTHRNTKVRCDGRFAPEAKRRRRPCPFLGPLLLRSRARALVHAATLTVGSCSGLPHPLPQPSLQSHFWCRRIALACCRHWTVLILVAELQRAMSKPALVTTCTLPFFMPCTKSRLVAKISCPQFVIPMSKLAIGIIARPIHEGTANTCFPKVRHPF